MANDREILKLVWEGKLPVCFNVDSDDLDLDLQSPDPFYLMVPRMSYLPLVTDKVRKHFSKSVCTENQDNEVWFDSNGIKLKWHFPIGVLLDLIMGENFTLPWNITMHFGNYPDDSIFKCPNKEVVESHFLSCLKEADALKHRGKVVCDMQKKDHTQLWLGLINDKFDQFWAVNRRLMEAIGDQDVFKHIPIRCYNEDGSYMQKLISPCTETGQKRTLQDLLDEFSTPVRKAVGARTQGICMPPETPLQWLSEHLSYPDNFLHLCLIFNESIV